MVSESQLRSSCIIKERKGWKLEGKKSAAAAVWLENVVFFLLLNNGERAANKASRLYVVVLLERKRRRKNEKKFFILSHFVSPCLLQQTFDQIMLQCQSVLQRQLYPLF